MTPFTIANPLFWALYMLLKSMFFSGWIFARWLAWLMSPVWITTAAVGAAAGFLTDR